MGFNLLHVAHIFLVLHCLSLLCHTLHEFLERGESLLIFSGNHNLTVPSPGFRFSVLISSRTFRHFILTLDSRELETLIHILSTNVDQKSLETEFSIAICRPTGDQWQS